MAEKKGMTPEEFEARLQYLSKRLEEGKLTDDEDRELGQMQDVIVYGGMTVVPAGENRPIPLSELAAKRKAQREAHEQGLIDIEEQNKAESARTWKGGKSPMDAKTRARLKAMASLPSDTPTVPPQALQPVPEMTDAEIEADFANDLLEAIGQGASDIARKAATRHVESGARPSKNLSDELSVDTEDEQAEQR